MAGRSTELSDKRALPGPGPLMLIGGAQDGRQLEAVGGDPDLMVL